MLLQGQVSRALVPLRDDRRCGRVRLAPGKEQVEHIRLNPRVLEALVFQLLESTVLSSHWCFKLTLNLHSYIAALAELERDPEALLEVGRRCQARPRLESTTRFQSLIMKRIVLQRCFQLEPGFLIVRH